MSKFSKNFQKVTQVRHWTENLFSFRITRPKSFKFRSGEFVMIGLLDSDANGANPVPEESKNNLFPNIKEV